MFGSLLVRFLNQRGLLAWQRTFGHLTRLELIAAMKTVREFIAAAVPAAPISA
jgi:hypothetical protein